MVDDQGIEPVTSALSERRAEPPHQSSVPNQGIEPRSLPCKGSANATQLVGLCELQVEEQGIEPCLDRCKRSVRPTRHPRWESAQTVVRFATTVKRPVIPVMRLFPFGNVTVWSRVSMSRRLPQACDDVKRPTVPRARRRTVSNIRGLRRRASVAAEHPSKPPTR